MEKNWFILEGNQHKGPFSSPEVVDLFVNGKVNESDLLWKDGEDDWKALRDFEELTTMIEFQGTSLDINVSDVSLAKYRSQKRHKQMAIEQAKAKAELLKHTEEFQDDEPPPLPGLPIEDEIPESEVKPVEEAEPEPEVPEVPVVEIPIEPEPELEPEPVAEPIPEPEPEPEPADIVVAVVKEKKDHLLPLKTFSLKCLGFLKTVGGLLKQVTFKQWTMGVTCLIFLYVSMNFSFTGNDWDKWILTYPKPLQQQFVETISKTGPVNGSFFWDYKEKQLFGALNRAGTGHVEVVFKSVKDKIIANKPVVIKAKGNIDKHQILFEPIQFEEGREVIPGYYTYEIHGYQGGALINLFEYFDFKKAGYEKELFATGETAFFEGSEEIFKESLGRFNQKRKEKELRPVQELLQQYKTFNSLLAELNNAYSVHLDTIKEGKQIKRFERQYMEKIGPLLQGLILDNYKTKNDLKDKDPDQATRYTRLISFGKSIASLAVEMSRKTRLLGKLKEDHKKNLLGEFSEKVDMLKQKGQIRIQHFTKKISELNQL